MCRNLIDQIPTHITRRLLNRAMLTRLWFFMQGKDSYGKPYNESGASYCLLSSILRPFCP
eukprot:COSAG06_NODE_2287_length_7155_cov_20.776927_7_plen_60_part_00